MAETFADAGYLWNRAGDGKRLSRAGGGHYDLIISDLKMPRMDGIQLFGALRGIAPEMADRIMFVTGDVIGTTPNASWPKAAAAGWPSPFASMNCCACAGSHERVDSRQPRINSDPPPALRAVEFAVPLDEPVHADRHRRVGFESNPRVESIVAAAVAATSPACIAGSSCGLPAQRMFQRVDIVHERRRLAIADVEDPVRALLVPASGFSPSTRDSAPRAIKDPDDDFSDVVDVREVTYHLPVSEDVNRPVFENRLREENSAMSGRPTVRTP